MFIVGIIRGALIAGDVAILHTKTGEVVQEFTVVLHGSFDVDFTPDGSNVLYSGANGNYSSENIAERSQEPYLEGVEVRSEEITHLFMAVKSW